MEDAEAGFVTGRSEVFKCHLPYLLQEKPLVSLSEFKRSVAAVLVSRDGNISFWPDVGQPGNMVSERVAGNICALSASSCKAGLIAAVCCEDGSVHILHYSGALKLRKIDVNHRQELFSAWLSILQTLNQHSKVRHCMQAEFSRRLSERKAAVAAALKSSAIVARASTSERHSDSVQVCILTEEGVVQWKIKPNSEELLWMLPREEVAGPAGGELLDVALPPAVSGLPRPNGIAILASRRAQQGEEAVISVAAAFNPRTCQVQSRNAVGGLKAARHARLCTNANLDVFLLWGPGQPPVAWTSQGGVKHVTESAVWAATASQDDRSWRLLCPGKGEVTLPMRTASVRREGHRGPAPSQQPGAAHGAGMTAQEAAFALLEEVVASGVAREDLATNLESLGALSGRGAEGPVAAFSSKLANALPKHWGGGGTVSEQLRQKQNRHNLLLQILSQSDVLSKLPPADLRMILENGEKIAAVGAIRETEDALQAAHDLSGLQPVQSTVSAAGQAVQASFRNREDWELFYSKPAETAVGFFLSMQHTLTAHRASYNVVYALSHAALAALGGAGQQHAWQTQWFASHIEESRKTGRPEWTAETPIRDALMQICRSLAAMLPSLQSEAPDTLKDACSVLLQLATPLLNAFAAAQTALGSSGALAQEYADARSMLLRPLLKHAILWCKEGDEDGELLLQSVETTAEAHRGYEQLFDIAEFKESAQHLYERMRELLPSDRTRSEYGRGTLAAYVFSRLRAEGRLGELLMLPAEFNEELHAWIKNQAADKETLRLRWLHEIRVGSFKPAASTLRKLSGAEALDAALVDLERLACLSKLADLASQKPGQPSDAAQVDLQPDDVVLVLADAQRKLGLREGGLLPAQALLEEAVDKNGGAEHAFDILGVGGRVFRQRNREVWKSALRKLVSEYAWEEVHAQIRSLSEEEFLQLLRTTAVARVSAACYGSESRMLCYGGRFEEDFPVDEAAAVLREEARSHFAAAEPDISLAFSLGVERS